MISALVELFGNAWQVGDLAQAEALARSLLVAIPDDVVAMQFLGLALYRQGRQRAGLRLWRRAAVRTAVPPGAPLPDAVLESASAVSWREATRPDSRLAAAWRELAVLLADHGLRQTARQARLAAFRAGRWMNLRGLRQATGSPASPAACG